MFLKINQNTNRWITIATVSYIVLLTSLLFIQISQIRIEPILYNVFTLLLGPLYILLIVYLIEILITFREKPSLSAAFTMYVCLEVITFIDKLFGGRLMGSLLTTTSGIMISVVIIYLFILTLGIKNQYIAIPYKLFGFSLLIFVLSIYFITLVFPMVANRRTMNYLQLISLLTPISILLILNGVSKFIKEENIKM